MEAPQSLMSRLTSERSKFLSHSLISLKSSFWFAAFLPRSRVIPSMKIAFAISMLNLRSLIIKELKKEATLHSWRKFWGFLMHSASYSFAIYHFWMSYWKMGLYLWMKFVRSLISSNLY